MKQPPSEAASGKISLCNLCLPCFQVKAGRLHQQLSARGSLHIRLPEGELRRLPALLLRSHRCVANEPFDRLSRFNRIKRRVNKEEVKRRQQGIKSFKKICLHACEYAKLTNIVKRKVQSLLHDAAGDGFQTRGSRRTLTPCCGSNFTGVF